MEYLVDTNVLLRLTDAGHALHPPILATIRRLRLDGHGLRVAAQNLIEFWRSQHPLRGLHQEIARKRASRGP